MGYINSKKKEVDNEFMKLCVVKLDCIFENVIQVLEQVEISKTIGELNELNESRLLYLHLWGFL